MQPLKSPLFPCVAHKRLTLQIGCLLCLPALACEYCDTEHSGDNTWLPVTGLRFESRLPQCTLVNFSWHHGCGRVFDFRAAQRENRKLLLKLTPSTHIHRTLSHSTTHHPNYTCPLPSSLSPVLTHVPVRPMHRKAPKCIPHVTFSHHQKNYHNPLQL